MAPLKMSWDIEMTPGNVDVGGRWMPSAMMVSMQELAEEHAAAFGNSRAALVEKGVVWVLARARIEMSRLPELGETVRLTTWAGKTVRALFPRYFSMEDEHGCLIGTAVTLWILVDVAQHRMTMPSAAGVEMPEESALPATLPHPGKLSISGKCSTHKRRCAYSDLDVNRHMNNTRYAQWICDLLAPSRLEKNPMQTLQINYISEAKPGEEMALELYDHGAHIQVRGKDAASGAVIFEAEMGLEEGERA